MEEKCGCPEAVSVLCDELGDLRCRADALLGAWDDAAEHGAALAAEAAAETGGAARPDDPGCNASEHCLIRGPTHTQSVGPR